MRFSAAPLRVCAAILLGASASMAAATHLEVQAGRSYMDSYPTNTVFVEGVFNEQPIGGSRFGWSPDVSLGWINGRDVAGYRYSPCTTHDDVRLLAIGARFHYGEDGDWYHPLFFSFQPAAQSGRTQALSSGDEFVSALGWQGRHVSLQIRHVSDAGLHDPNRGETMALVGWGFDI